MRHRSLGTAAATVVLATLSAGTGCALETLETLGVAVQPAAIGDWVLFNLADTNGDGLADVIWYSPSAHLIEVWLMTGTHVFAMGAPIPGPPGAGWAPVVSVDFNHDGLSDLVWTNASRGTMTVWLMGGTQLVTAGPEIQGPLGDGWFVAAAGDTNGDGMADVVWYNPGKQRASVWLMAGTHVLARGPDLLSPQHGERVLNDFGDMNGDGLADIVWTQAVTNKMEVWLMSGTRQLTPECDVPGPSGDGWTVVTLADFNFDGLADVIWTNASRGTMTVSLMRDARLFAAGPEIEGPAGGGWSVAYAADVNGDGMADAAWQKLGTSLFTVWLMNGTHVLAPGPILPGPKEIAAEP